MKTLVFVISFMSATLSQAATQYLYCTSGGSSAFTAALEHDISGPGYYSLKNARIAEGGFAEANLICAGNSNLSKVKCGGFWNNVGAEHVEVSFASDLSGIAMTYKPLTGTKTMNGTPWTCTIEQSQIDPDLQCHGRRGWYQNCE